MAVLIHNPNQADERIVILDAGELSQLRGEIEGRIDVLLTFSLDEPSEKMAELRELLAKLKETK